MNDKQVISGTCFSISQNILLIFIKKRLEDTNNFCDIPISTLHLRLINSSITSPIHLLIKKDFVYLIE